MTINRTEPYGSFMRRAVAALSNVTWDLRAVSLIFLAALTVGASAGSARAEPVRIVGLGDSLMAGYELGPGEGFVPVLGEKLSELGYEVEMIEAGVSGDTSTGGLARLEWSVPAEADIVIVELGGNDALRGIEPSITEANIDAIVDALRVRDQRVVLAGMLAPPNMGADYEAAFNGLYPRIAEARNVPLYPFFLDGVITDASLMLPDGIHPTAEGVEVMATRFLPTLLPVIDAVLDERGVAAPAGARDLVPAPNTTPPVDPAVPTEAEPA